MDENKKIEFKWKFYKLTIELNIIIVCVAVAVMAFFITQIPFRVPLIIGLLALALVLSVHFSGKYRETKAWLETNAPDKKEESGSKEGGVQKEHAEQAER
jgi:cell division protein FtsW (lipid II flippase)